MNVNDFFNNNVLSSFISNLCALIGITDTSRVKVVGVFTGSTIVQTVIVDGSSSNSTNGTSTNSTGGASLAQIQAAINNNNAMISSSLATSLNTTVISLSSTLYTVTTTTT